MRCKAYRRASGIILWHAVRCELEAGHAGRHYAAGAWLDPRAAHRWGRDRPDEYGRTGLHGADGWCGETRPHTHGLSEGIIRYA